MRAVVDWVHSLPLPSMFLLNLALCLAGAIAILLAVRVLLRRLGYGEGRPLVLKDAAVTTASRSRRTSRSSGRPTRWKICTASPKASRRN